MLVWIMEFTKSLPSYPDIPSPTCIHCMKSADTEGFARVCDAIQGHSQEGVLLDVDAYLCSQCSLQAAMLFGGLSKTQADLLRTESAPIKEENEKLAQENAVLRDRNEQVAALFSAILEREI